MKEFKYSRVLEKLYYEKLDNGFEICVVPVHEKKNFYAILGTRYGSKDISFIPLNKKDFIKTHNGVAHFLEHKAFEMKDGEDPFTFFSKMGSGANASTGFDTTKFYVWGSSRATENVNYLLDYVFSPYFTKENIAKEQGIIGEEIKMYDDDPGWIADDAARRLAFNELPIIEKISGTKETIAKITKEELYDCYNTFYVPNNMFLVVGGEVDPKEIIEMVKNNVNFNKIKPNYNIVCKEYHEIDEVKSEYKEIKMNIVLPKLKYMFKINCDTLPIKDKIKLDMYLNIIGSITFGSTSIFYEKIRNENIANVYYLDHNYYDNYYTYEFDAESDKADIFKDEVDKEITNLKIKEEDFLRMKKVWIASEIKISDNIELLTENTYEDMLYYHRVCPERIDIIESLNMKELNEIINAINWNNNCFVLINPKEL